MSKIFKYILIIPLILLVSLYSCKDNPTTTTSQDFAPARFNWRAEEIPYYGGFAGIWAQDTNNIFLINNYSSSLYIVSHGNIQNKVLGTAYWIDDIIGISPNEVYIFGAEQGGNATIIKWNGGGFEYYTTNIPSNFNWNIPGCIGNSNDIWICTANGIAKFDGIKFTYYNYPDPLLNPLYFFKSVDTKIQYIGQKRIDSVRIQESLYEFKDTGFVRTFNDTLSENSELNFLQELSGYKYGVSVRQRGFNEDVCIKYFNDFSFQNYFCFNQKITGMGPTSQNNPIGMNLQNFIVMINTVWGVFDSTRYGICNWDGKSLSKELRLWGNTYPPFSKYLLFSIDINNYLVLEPIAYTMNNVTLYIGTRK